MDSNDNKDIYRFFLERPRLGKRVFIDPAARVSGAVELGDDVTVGHAAILHACTIGDRCLVGMGAIVMDGAAS